MYEVHVGASQPMRYPQFESLEQAVAFGVGAASSAQWARIPELITEAHTALEAGMLWKVSRGELLGRCDLTIRRVGR